MAEPEDEDDALKAAQAFRPNRRPVAIALGANVLLAVLCLGLPYYRGHVQAQSSLRAFASFASCLLDAEPGRALGLGMPVGERERYAGLFMLGPQSWPKRCMPALRAIAPDEATFLWPSVKQAGADVRALVQLQARELVELEQARAHRGRVPERPLLALERLRGGLTLLARAAGADDDIDSDAVRFVKPSPATEPSRLPIVAGTTAPLTVSAGQDGLHALALDGRGISVLRVAEGKVDRRRVRRTSLVRGALELDGEPLLVWAMPPERCEQAEDHCARRTMGVAVLGPEELTLPEPTWLGAHPRGRIDRSLRVGLGRQLDVLALADASGALEVRRFRLPDVAASKSAPEPDAAAAAPDPSQAAAAAPPKTPPLAAETRVSIPSPEPPSDALLLQRTHAAVFTMHGGDGLDASLFTYLPQDGSPPGAPRSLGHARGEGAWIEACEHGGGALIAFGTSAQLVLARIDDHGVPSTSGPSFDLDLGEPLSLDDAGHDRVHVLCDGDHSLLVIATARGDLQLVHCDATTCGAPTQLAERVATFDAAQTSQGALVVYSQSEEPQLRVQRLDADGALLGAPSTPAPCWDPAGGMCGKPTLAADSGRLLLCARDGSDLLVLESDDGGGRWKPLSGLKVSSATSTDVSSPMDQHRKRKGLD